MNKYNEFFAYIENKRMREAQLDQVLTLADFDFFKNQQGNNPVDVLYGLNFYRALYNFKKFIEIVNTNIMYDWKSFKFEIPRKGNGEDRIINTYATTISNPTIKMEGTNNFLMPLPQFALNDIKEKNKGEDNDLRYNKALFVVNTIDTTSSIKKFREKYYAFEISNKTNNEGIPYAFLLYGKNLTEKELCSIFIPSSEWYFDGITNEFSVDKNDINSLNIKEFYTALNNYINNIPNSVDKNNSNNKSISSGINELQAKAAADIIINIAKDTIKDKKLNIQYKNLFLRNNQRMINKNYKNEKWKEDELNLIKIGNKIKDYKKNKNISEQFLYIGYKPIQFQEKSYKANINSTNSKEIGSELVECYFNFYLSINNNDIKKELLQLLIGNYKEYINTFEDFSKVFFQKLIGNLQNNKTTINDNNIIYTLGFKQGNYFKMENPLSCKFSIIVGKDVGRQSKLTNVVNFINNTSQKNPNSALYTNNRVVNMR